jgi:hypothetical protein
MCTGPWRRGHRCIRKEATERNLCKQANLGSTADQRPWPRKRGARIAERRPAQEANNPLKGRTPRMPPGWNKPGRCGGETRRGRKNPAHVDEPIGSRNGQRRTRPARKSPAGPSGDRNRSEGNALVVWKPSGTQPPCSASKGTRTSGRDADGHLHFGARTGWRPAPTRDEVERKAERCAGLCDLGRVMRRSEAEDLKNQAIAAKVEEEGRIQ